MGTSSGRKLPGITFRAYHVFFVVALLALLTLGAWWFLLNWRQVERLHTERLENLTLRAQLIQWRLGSLPGETPPALQGDEPFEILPVSDLTKGEPRFVLSPNWPARAVRVKPEVIRSMEERHQSQQLMVTGEGSLMMLLISVCIFILYRLLLSEIRSRREMTLFFHAVSHELKTPVAGVKALLQTLAGMDLQKADIARYSRMGLRETARLQVLVDNILLHNRIDRRVFSPQPRALEIVTETREFIERRNGIHPEKPVTCSLECREDLRVVADPNLMAIAMENLINNAFRYGPKDVIVRVILRETEEWGMIVVEDNGPGLPPEELERIFLKFHRYRNRQSPEETKSGSGLGLFIVRTLVESFGGEAQALSEGIGSGCRFVLRLRKTE